MKTELRTGLRVLVITMAFFAAFHLLLLVVASVLRADISLLNPIEFLGLSAVWPDLQNIRGGSMLFWMVIVNTYLMIYMAHAVRLDRKLAKRFQPVTQHIFSMRAVDKLRSLLLGSGSAR